MSVVGIDVGTTGCKAIAINCEGEIISSSYKEYKLIQNTKELEWMELDSTEVWEAVKTVLKNVSVDTKGDLVEGISVSAMGDTITPFNKDLEPTYNSILAFDTRTEKEVEILRKLLGKQNIFQITGMPIHEEYSASKILWIKNNLPEIFKKTEKFLCYEDYILTKLGASPAISYSNAARTMMFDISEKKWDKNILDKCGIDVNYLAKPVRSGTYIGDINKKIAQELQLPGDIKLFSGGHDQTCGALGAGVISENYALDSTGTLEILLVTYDEPILTDDLLDANICCYPHCYNDKYCSFGQIFTAGAAYRWFRDEFAYKEILEAQKTNKSVYDLINSKMPKNPANLYFIPYLSGSGTPFMDPTAKGVIYGLTLNTNKYEIAKAILEGITYELKINLDLMESIGVNIENLISIGGGAKSEKWLQLKADITGKIILANKYSDLCPIGAAVIAGYGIGMFSDMKDGINSVKKTTRKYYPDNKKHNIYKSKYEKYKDLQNAIKNFHFG